MAPMVRWSGRSGSTVARPAAAFFAVPMSHDLERPTPPPSRTAHVADSSAATPRRPPETRPRRIARLVIFGLAILGLLAGIGVLVMHLRADPLADVRAYYDAGTRLNAGQPLYPPGAD